MEKEDAFLEISILKCPNCKNLIAEPTWFLELEQDITCQVCKKSFGTKRNEIDRKLVKFIIENGKIIKTKIVLNHCIQS